MSLYCRKHGTTVNFGKTRNELCSICDEPLIVVRKEGLAVCGTCAVKHNLCIVCGKELEFDNEAL